jgi:hypothetical protein
MRFTSRYTLFKEFRKMATDESQAVVHVAEARFGNRPSEVPKDGGYDTHIVFNIHDEVWHKEGIINAAVSRLPNDWEYVAWVDADVAFTNPFWVQETIQQLQHYPVVQMFHTAWDLDPENNPLRQFKGFPASLEENPNEPDIPGNSYYYGVEAAKMGFWHPGYAWACTRKAWDTFGGLLDVNIVGGGDHQMANALIGRVKKTIPAHSTPAYRRAVLGWESHALLLKKNIGYVPGTLLHYWHGKKVKRGYFDRWKILTQNKYDPITDVRYDWQGLLQLAGNKPKLRDDLRAYFRQRQEDSIDM